MVLLRAKEATIYIDDPLASVSASIPLYLQITGGTDFSGRVKSIEISGAEADTSTVYLFGSDTNGRQNAEVEEENMTDREFSGTLIYTDNVPASWASGGITTVGTTGYTRVQGDGVRTPKSVMLKFLDSAGSTLYVVLNNARAIKLGDISLDAEGHAEQEIVFKCKASDYYEDYHA